jgi:hypothetical protein
MKHYDNYAFTLVEILVVIILIILITFWSLNFNFSFLEDSQNLNIFSNKIITNFEEIRNNNILWKWIGTSLEVPKKWRIDFIRSGNGLIETYYNTSNWELYNSLAFENNYKMISVECMNIDESFKTNIVQSWSILFNNNEMLLDWECNDTRYKKIRLKLTYKNNFEKIIEINTINGLIETKK